MSKTELFAPTAGEPADPVSSFLETVVRHRAAKRQWWWSQSGSNRRPQACKASALPTELWPHWIKPLAMVGRVGVEPTTSRLSGVRSNHLSYRPPVACRPKGRGRREPAQAAPLCCRDRTAACAATIPRREAFPG